MDVNQQYFIHILPDTGFQASTIRFRIGAAPICVAFIFINLQMPKIYQVWAGNNRFFCGCCVTGQNQQGIVCINMLTLALFIPFSILVAPANWKISPALLLASYVSIILQQIFLYLAACSDPGILPRLPFVGFTRTPVSVNRTEANEKHQFCQTCLIVRPSRASHCIRCQNCVQMFDHHCGLIGNCIGRRNYRYFMLFIGSLFIAFLLLLANMIVFIVQKRNDDQNATFEIVIVSAVGSIIGTPLILFFCFHVYLSCIGSTTREVVKGIKEEKREEINQWCDVSDSILDFYQVINDEQANSIKAKIEELKNPMFMPNSSRYLSTS